MAMLSNIFSREKEKWILAGLIVLIIVTALNVILSRVRLSSTTPSTSGKTATLSLQTSASTVNQGDKITVQVVLSPGSNEVDAVDAVLTYDTSKLEATQVVAGSLFGTYPVQSTGGNKVQISGFTLPTNDGTVSAATNTGIVGTVTFKAKATGQAQIDFDAENVVVASKGKDVLQKTSGVAINVK